MENYLLAVCTALLCIAVVLLIILLRGSKKEGKRAG